jgi:hypothetical protein
MELAQKQANTATDDYQFTHLINNNYNQPEKIKLIKPVACCLCGYGIK